MSSDEGVIDLTDGIPPYKRQRLDAGDAGDQVESKACSETRGLSTLLTYNAQLRLKSA